MVKICYLWHLDCLSKQRWSKIVCSRANIARHAFISWIFMNTKLPVKQRMGQFHDIEDMSCIFCQSAVEDTDHLFFGCSHANDIWGALLSWWKTPIRTNNCAECSSSLLQLKG